MKRILQNFSKSVVATTLILAFSLTFSQAQEIHFGAKAGLTVSDISYILSPGSPLQSPSNVTLGFHVGAIIDIGFNDHISLTPEILYTTAGAKENINYTMADNIGIPFTVVTTGTMSINLGYIQVPVMLKYKMDNGLNFSVGPTLSMLMMSSYLGNETVTTTVLMNPPVKTSGSSTPAGKLDSAMEKMDIGFAIGGGYQFDFGLGFGIRYIFGMSDNFKGGVTYPDTNSPYPRTITQGSYGKNEIFQFSISYLFGTNK